MLNSDEIDRFLAFPGEYFDFSLTKMMSVPREQLEPLQLAGLKRRFQQFRGHLPMMDKLADSQGIDAINTFDDVAPLLFDHAIYKSYPASLLDKHRYAQLTTWLNKLTTIDLSRLDVSACHSIDDWMITLKRETPLSISHTSGTSGSMSFLPWTKSDWRKMMWHYPIIYFQRCGENSPVLKPPLNIECIYPFFRTGGLSHVVLNDTIVEVIAGNEERFHAAFPSRLSADMMLLAARRRAAAAKGTLDQLVVSPEMELRRAEFEAQQRDMPRQQEEFFSTMRTRLAGKRIFMLATTNMLVTLAKKGLEQGMRKVFAPDSVVITGGGGKGVTLPDNWEAMIQEFFGVERVYENYGMSEMTGSYLKCKHGHFHGTPWLIPFLLNPVTGQPLPRKGTVTGRYGFYDLMTDTRWGGFVTGDEITMEFDAPCACGQSGPYIHGKVQRYSEKKDADVGEEKLSCATAPEAYAEALDFLNEGTAI